MATWKDPFSEIRRLPKQWQDTKTADAFAFRMIGAAVLIGGPLAIATAIGWMLSAQGIAVGNPWLWGVIYSPISVLRWYRVDHAAFTAPVWIYAGAAVAVVIAIGVALAKLIHFAMTSNARTVDDSRGSARVSTLAEQRSASLFDYDGAMLGFVRVPYTMPEMIADAIRQRSVQPFLVPYKEMILRGSAEWHTILVGPNGSGKTQDFYVPTLLLWRGSVLVYDLKGDLYISTAGWRAANEGMGSSVYCIMLGRSEDPRITATGFFNPLDSIGIDPGREYQDANEMVQALASLSVGEASQGGKSASDAFFSSLSRSLLTALWLWQIYMYRNAKPERCNIAYTLHMLSTLSDPENVRIFQTLIQGPHAPTARWRDGDGNPTNLNPFLVNLANRCLSQLTVEQRGSVIINAATYLEAWNNDVIAEATSRTNFDPRDMIDPTKNLSIYLYCPYSVKSVIQPVVRVLLHALLRRMVRGSVPYRTARGRCLIAFDEFDSIGGLPVIANDLNELRSFGVSTAIGIQGYNQLYRRYTHDEPITMAGTAHIIYRPNDSETKKKVSEDCGVFTSRHKAPPGSGDGKHIAYVDDQRALLSPDEVGAMPSTRALVFVGTDIGPGKAALRPIYAYRRHAYLDPEFAYRMSFAPPSTSPVDSPSPGLAGTHDQAA